MPPGSRIGASFTLLAALVVGVVLPSACRKEATPPASVPPSSGPSLPLQQPSGNVRIQVEVTEAGFVPDTIAGEVGKPMTLVVTRKTDRTCARELVIKGQPGKTELPLGHPVEVAFTPTAAGRLPFGCAMGMMVSGTFDIR